METDYVYLTELEAIWAQMLTEVLDDQGVPYTTVPVYGAALSIGAGVRERWKLYVPAREEARARELLAELFPQTQP